jgi:hypothetical protein
MATGDFCKNYNYQNSSKNYLEHLNVERTKTNNSKVKKSENLEENQSFNNIVYGSVITPIYKHLVNEFSTKDVYYLDDIHLLSKNVYYLIKREFIKNNFIVL